MLAMSLFGISATNDAVDTAQQNLITRAIESDAVSARIMARGVERELDSWTQELREVAASPQLRKLLSSAAERDWKRRDALDQFLVNAQEQANRRRDATERLPDASWFVVDRNGYQRWRGPTNLATLDKRWAHRDYYHGRGREFLEDKLPDDLSPISKPHLSLAFQSRATQRAIVALSVPIVDDDGRLIAILAGTRELGSVLSAPYAEYKPSLDSADAASVARTIAILDSRDGRLLDHPWLQDQVKQAPVVKLDQATLLRLTALDDGDAVIELDRYADPVGREAKNFKGRWLAVFSPVGKFGWFAVVQERRDQALQPIDAMRSNVLKTWQGALIVSGLVLTLIWGIVLASLGRTRHRLRPNTPLSGLLSQPAPVSSETPGEGSDA